jgi:hypothetical protein
MSYESSIYCSLAEYTRGEADRVRESELSVGGLYTVMFSLRRPRRPVAVRYPAKIADLAVEERKDVGFVALDDDLRPLSPVLYAAISDGFIHFGRQDMRINSELIEAGYFKAYTEQDSTDLALRALLDLEAPLLV